MNLESNSDVDHAEAMAKMRAEIARLREALSDVCGVGGDARLIIEIAATALRHKPE